jgi:hypothetical protein
MKIASFNVENMFRRAVALNRWVVLRRSRGKLVTMHKDGNAEVVAGGRGDWIGWLELKREAVDEQAIWVELDL